MNYLIRKTRFSLFTQSFAGYRLSQYIKHSQKPRPLINRLAKMLLFEQTQLNCFIFHKTCQRKLSKIKISDLELLKRISIYIQIEKQLCQIYEEKFQSKDTDFEADYETGILDLALERTAGNSLTDIDNDQEFNELLHKRKIAYNYLYYYVAGKYRLPTIRIVPFLLRLISL